MSRLHQEKIDLLPLSHPPSPTFSHELQTPKAEIQLESIPSRNRTEGGGGGGGSSSSHLRLRTLIIIFLWIALSTAVILLNRRILVELEFPYPITLTSLHLLFQTIATRLLHRYSKLISGPPPPLPSLSTPVLHDDGEEKAWKDSSVEMDWVNWRTTILPPAVLFSLSLVLSNWAYLYLTVSFIHILKAFSPVAILVAAFIFRTKPFSLKLLFVVCIISLGVCLASLGESNFSVIGFSIQVTAILIEAVRVTMIQIILQGKSEMSPLKMLYFFAPICLVMQASLILPIEGLSALQAIPRLGLMTILFNCSLTFLLNLSAVYLISLSSMVLSLSKVVKDILLVGGSAVLFGAPLSQLQIGGYGLATVGIIIFKMI